MMSTRSSIEDALCSRVRLRILELLLESQMLNVSEIAARVGVNYVSASMHLKALENADVLSHVMFGKRIRYYRFKESARANAVKKLVEAWHSEDQT
jgi:predicted transcriptional regulator